MIKQLIIALVIAIALWPLAFYSRTYPAFGGESLLVITIVCVLIGAVLHERKENEHNEETRRTH